MLKPINIFISSIFFIFFVIFIYALILSFPLKCQHLDYYITIPKDSTVSSVSKVLDNNLCLNPLIFKIAMKITMNEKNIKYGRYDFKSTSNVRDLIELITSIKKDRVRMTISEGLKIRDIAINFEKFMHMNVEEFISTCYNQEFISSLGLNNISNLEGYLFPDTYIFLKTYTVKDVIAIMVKQFLFNYNENINEDSLELSRDEIVILASIIQGEAIYDDEMKTISSVYHNRLKKNMLLQADPTIQYILPKVKKRILVKDTKINNPYNTYLYKGLPPGPINNPGLSAIIAAAYPIETDYLYFVANNKGRHIFNKTFKGHIKSKK